MRVLVLCGTHEQPFDRLVGAATALAGAGHQVTVQRGVSAREAPGCVVVGVVPPRELARLADAAELIVGHAAPGTAFLAWERGLRPVLVPRRASEGEHVDDHQGAFAARVQGRALVVEDPDQLVAMVEALHGVVPTVPDGQGGISPAFLRQFSELASEVASKARHPGRKRATVRHVLQALGRRS